MSTRTLSTVVFAVSLLMFSTACHPKPKTRIDNPPPPQPPGNTDRIGTPKPEVIPAARITTFTAEPRTIERGQSATLRWSIGNATDMSIDQNLGAVTATGSRQVFPSQTTTYTLTAVGPTGQDSRSVTVEVATGPPPPPPGPKGPTVNGTELLGREAQDVYFDYDKAEFRDDARQALAHNAEVLKRIFAVDPRFNVVIEGHCDERGSAEYNLGLGDRRASAAKEYLVQLGVPADRLTTISYGKERPQCTDADEACYQKNRRAHLGPGR